jgi:hypothetical protein
MRSLLHHFATAGLLAAGAVLGGGLIGYPAIAFAEWDVGAYDQCMEEVGLKQIHNEIDDQTANRLEKACCLDTGGNWNKRGPYALSFDCFAPPANVTVVPPERPLPEVIATATLEPAPGNPSVATP